MMKGNIMVGFGCLLVCALILGIVLGITLGIVEIYMDAGLFCLGDFCLP